MRPIFLAYHHPAGVTKYAPLETANEPIFYLPDGVEDEIELDTARPSGRNDVAQIELISYLPFLCAYGKEICQLIHEGQSIAIPASTYNSIKYVLLRDGDQFETSAGRWSIQRDDEQGTIQNSMRPPPLPEMPNAGDLEQLSVVRGKEDALTRPLTPLPAELDDDVVDDVPYSDDLPHKVKEETPISTSNHNTEMKKPGNTSDSTQESSRDMLNKALDDMADSSCDTTDPPTQPVDGIIEVPAEPAPPVASKSMPSTDNDAQAASDAPPPKRRRRNPEMGSKTSKRRKVNQGRLTSTEEEHCQPQVEETIVVAPDLSPPEESPKPSNEEHPSPSKKLQKRRVHPAKTAAPTSTPEPKPTPTATNSSPLISSNRSTRSHRSKSIADSSSGSYVGSPVVYFASNTTIDEEQKPMKTFYDLGGKKAKSIGDANMLCAVDGQLKKSEAFLVAIAQGADIVTEEWVAEGHRKRKFPDPLKFLPKAKAHEQAWGFRLNDAIQRGKEGLTDLLSGTTVYITAQFKNEMGKTCNQGIKNVATALGADAVKPVPRNGRRVQNAFVIGMAEDTEACQVGRLGMKLYDKELLTSAVLKGELDLDSNEYAITIPVKEEDGE